MRAQRVTKLRARQLGSVDRRRNRDVTAVLERVLQLLADAGQHLLKFRNAQSALRENLGRSLGLDVDRVGGRTLGLPGEETLVCVEVALGELSVPLGRIEAVEELLLRRNRLGTSNIDHQRQAGASSANQCAALHSSGKVAGNILRHLTPREIGRHAVDGLAEFRERISDKTLTAFLRTADSHLLQGLLAEFSRRAANCRFSQLLGQFLPQETCDRLERTCEQPVADQLNHADDSPAGNGCIVRRLWFHPLCNHVVKQKSAFHLGACANDPRLQTSDEPGGGAWRTTDCTTNACTHQCHCADGTGHSECLRRHHCRTTKEPGWFLIR